VRLHPLSGHVDIKSGEYRRPDDIVAGSDVPQ
jgi:hypothetical protein